MKLPRKKIFFYVIVLIVILITSFVVGFYFETRKEKKVTEKAPTSGDVPSATSSGEYTVRDQNVIPLGRNLESENFGFSLLKIS